MKAKPKEEAVCLMCQTKFLSTNKKTNRICYECKKKQRNVVDCYDKKTFKDPR